jgi:hypothetical protein
MIRGAAATIISHKKAQKAQTGFLELGSLSQLSQSDLPLVLFVSFCG